MEDNLARSARACKRPWDRSGYLRGRSLFRVRVALCSGVRRNGQVPVAHPGAADRLIGETQHQDIIRAIKGTFHGALRCVSGLAGKGTISALSCTLAAFNTKSSTFSMGARSRSVVIIK